jgi:hypothetical protein
METVIETFRNDKDLCKLSKSILVKIKEDGFVIINKNCSILLYNELAKKLGNIIMENDIKVTPSGKFAAFRSAEVLPHTDSVDAHIIGWFCIEQDKRSGESQVTNIGDIKTSFSIEEIDFLKSYKSPLISECHKTSGKIKGLNDSPLIITRWDSLKVNYAPWLKFSHDDKEKNKILIKFKSYMDDRIKNHTQSFLLKQNEIMFIDNGQVLHSRKSIETNSKRCLRRLWIKTK